MSTRFKSVGGRRRNTGGRMGRLIREEKAETYGARDAEGRRRDDRRDGGEDRHTRD